MAEKKSKGTRSTKASRRETYTYRCGEKVPLAKKPDQFVVRRLPTELPMTDIRAVSQVSSASCRVTCDAADLEEMMARSREIAPTHHAYTEAEGSDFLITDRVLVCFDSALDAEAIAGFAGDYGLQIVETYSGHDYLLRLTDATGMNPVKLVVRLTEDQDQRVTMVDHDLNIEATRYLDLPADPTYDDQWHLHQRTPPSPEYDRRSSARCEEAWQLLDSFGDSDVVIGFTDDGCKLDHPDFDSAGKFAGWGYFEGTRLFRRGDPGADPRRMYTPGEDHGTSCGGVIAAEIDGEMTVGAAPACRLLPIKWQLTGNGGLAISDSKMLKALDYVSNKVDVLSNSWGSTPTTRLSQTVRNRLQQLAKTGGRRGKGIVFLWAAGNENCPISFTGQQDVPFDDGVDVIGGQGVWVGVQTSRVFRNDRVGIPGVMHIAALASNAQRSHYSNYGAGIDLCAPSSNSHEYHRLNVPGLGIATTTGSGSLVTHGFGGTSSATPLVAGVAGLAISTNPDLTALEVVSLLESTASKDLDMTGYPRTPPAGFNPDTSWDISPVAPFDSGAFENTGEPEGSWSPWFGHGRVDAAEVVRQARGQQGANLQQVVVERDADLSIPDSNPAGVVSPLFVEARGRIDRLQVAVDISHTFRGDLRVVLVAPTGQRVVLHNGEGSGAHDLKRTYEAADTPALAQLHGGEIHGRWALEVSDHAPVDVGRLNRWSLAADVITSGILRRESTPGRSIPDNDPTGINDTLSIADSRILSGLEVEVDISHTFIRDLRVELEHPSGARVMLHDRSGGGADNIRRNFTVNDVADLATFLGQPANGSWVLRVSDHEGQDVGKLNRWALEMK